MGWLQLVGSIKLQVSCTGYSLFYGALLQKKPIILLILLVAATPEVFDTPCETLVPVGVLAERTSIAMGVVNPLF